MESDEVNESNVSANAPVSSSPASTQFLSEDTVSSASAPTTTSVRRKLRTLGFGRKKKSHLNHHHLPKCKDSPTLKRKKRTSSGWGFKLCARTDSCADVSFEHSQATTSCVCTGFRKTEDIVTSKIQKQKVYRSVDNVVMEDEDDSGDVGQPPVIEAGTSQPCVPPRSASRTSKTSLETKDVRADDANIVASLSSYPDQEAVTSENSADSISSRQENVEPPRISRSLNTVPRTPTMDEQRAAIAASSPNSVIHNGPVRVAELALALRSLTVNPYPYLTSIGQVGGIGEVAEPGFLHRFCLRGNGDATGSGFANENAPIHTQVDYIHRLVPDMKAITNCSFYWGKMDRYEAEKLLENKPEGTFLLRDSAQEEHLFSVSFRRFDRSLHARIEQLNDRFSFDSHDPGVFSSKTVCGLIEHYKDPSHCMFFEPMLTLPLHRNFPFSLQHMCRTSISACVTYDSINCLQLPKRMKSFLKEYHYKQQVRVRRLDVDH